MKKLSVLLLLTLSIAAGAQSQNETAIRKLLQQQTEAWNKGDLEGFMQGYWRDDSLLFVSSRNVVWGWQNTLNNYKNAYPDAVAMGKLTFDIIQVKPLAPDYYFVVGKWMLEKAVGDFSGHYTILLRKIKGKWQIVADHSS